MRDECIAEVETALGRALRAGESRKIEDAVNLQHRLLAQKDPEAWAKLGSLDRLQQAATAAAAEMTRQAKLKQRNLQLQIDAHDRIENWWADRQELLPEKAKAGDQLNALSEMLGFSARGKGMQSVETASHSVANGALGRLKDLWDAQKGFMGIFQSRDGIRDLVRELHGEDTGNAMAKKGAQAWHQVTEELRERANATGMDIGKLMEWALPQNHSQGRIASAGLEKWTEDTLPLLNRDKYVNVDGQRYNDDQMRDFLRHAYDTIITDGLNKRELGQIPYGTSGRKGDAHRQIFFKDADSFLEYSGDYGSKNLWSTLVGHVQSISRDIGINETLGPNPEQTFRYFNDRTKLDELRQARNKSEQDKINTAAKKNESLYDYVAGHREVVNQKVAEISQSFRNLQVATKLGKVIITALTDEAGMAATAFANKVPWSSVFLREFKYLNPANSADRAAMTHVGVGINSMIGNLNRFGYEDLQLAGGDGATAGVRNFTSKLGTGVMHASGAEAMWDARRRALGSVLLSAVGKLTRDVPNFEDLNRADHGILADKGVTKNDWEAWKLAQTEDWGQGARSVITPKTIDAIPDEALAHLGDPDAIRRHASTMLRGHILEETGMGVMDTGARQRASTYGQVGSAPGELWRAFMLFKSFSASMMQKHWARAADMPTAGGSWQYAARLMVAGTVMGALGNQIRNFISGKDPDNMAEPKFWGEAALRGGGLGFYGEFLHAELTSHDTSLAAAVGGPLLTEGESIWNLTGAAALKHARGERTDEGAKLIRYARSEIPFLNMWYTQAAMDHILWNEMQEAASPGYLDRMQARAYKDKGTTYFWDPHENLPSQGPDFAKMIRPDEGRRQMQAIADAVPFAGSSE